METINTHATEESEQNLTSGSLALFSEHKSIGQRLLELLLLGRRDIALPIGSNIPSPIEENSHTFETR